MFIRKARKLFRIITAGNRLFFAGLRHGVAAGIEHLVVLRGLGCETVVDIGANRGQFSLAARECFPDAAIIAFEPLPAPAEIFVRVFSKDDLTKIHQVAIGPRSENRKMHVSNSDDSSSLLPISALQNEIFPGTSEAGTTDVQVAPLDMFVSEDEMGGSALLKLDVQGFELDALQGCEGLLQQFRWIYCECSFVELYFKPKIGCRYY
jgi:FkbM family methyltransferase